MECSKLLMFAQHVLFSEREDEEVGAESIDHKVVWRQFRGHHGRIRSVYRTEWCLAHDFVAIELVDGQIVVWNVATSQIERRFYSVAEATPFAVDRSLAASKRRGDCFGAEWFGMYRVYDLHRSSGHLRAHSMVLDVAAVLRQSEGVDLGFVGDDGVDSAGHLVAALSLLMDWDIHSDAVHSEFAQHFERCLASTKDTKFSLKDQRHFVLV